MVGFPGSDSGKEFASAGDTRDAGSIPGLERHSNPLQYSCLKDPMNREAWWATVHRITKTQTKLKPLSRQASITGEEVYDVINKIYSGGRGKLMNSDKAHSAWPLTSLPL